MQACACCTLDIAFCRPVSFPPDAVHDPCESGLDGLDRFSLVQLHATPLAAASPYANLERP